MVQTASKTAAEEAISRLSEKQISTALESHHIHYRVRVLAPATHQSQFHEGAFNLMLHPRSCLSASYLIQAACRRRLVQTTLALDVLRPESEQDDENNSEQSTETEDDVSEEEEVRQDHEPEAALDVAGKHALKSFVPVAEKETRQKELADKAALQKELEERLYHPCNLEHRRALSHSHTEFSQSLHALRQQKIVSSLKGEARPAYKEPTPRLSNS